MIKKQLKDFTVSALTFGVLVGSQGALAHSTLATRTAPEATTIYNNLQIGHGCEESNVIANSVVFPDGTDSTITVTDAEGAVTAGTSLADYVNGVPAIRHVLSNDVFEKNKPAYGRATPALPVGIHSWKGNMPAHDSIGLVPMRLGGVQIVEESCATSVKFEVAVADVCKITNIAGFANPANVNFWTPFVAGSNFNRADGENEAATFTVTRTSALPESCGAGVAVTVTPSAAQLNHDMPIPRIWPGRR